MDCFCQEACHVVGVGSRLAVMPGKKQNLDCSLMTERRHPCMAVRGRVPWEPFFYPRAIHCCDVRTVYAVWLVGLKQNIEWRCFLYPG
jgi:hypothetical protein